MARSIDPLGLGTTWFVYMYVLKGKKKKKEERIDYQLVFINFNIVKKYMRFTKRVSPLIKLRYLVFISLDIVI